MMDGKGITEGIVSLFKTGAVLLAIFVPLGLWKAVELIVSLF